MMLSLILNHSIVESGWRVCMIFLLIWVDAIVNVGVGVEGMLDVVFDYE